MRTGSPGEIGRLWFVVLLGPVAWATALGVLFSLTNEACVSGTRQPMFAVAAACLACAIAAAIAGWTWRRRVLSEGIAADRVRFMLGIATGAGVLFTLVLLLSSVPIFLLDSCRT